MCAQVEQVWAHAGFVQHSLYIIPGMNKAAGIGDGPTEEATAACFAMYEEYCNWGEAQLNKHGKPFLAGTDTPTIADFKCPCRRPAAITSSHCTACGAPRTHAHYHPTYDPHSALRLTVLSRATVEPPNTQPSSSHGQVQYA